MAKSPKTRMRDTFYMEMWDKYEIEKDEIILILQKAGFESTFEPNKLVEYEEAIKKAKQMDRIKKNMVPFPRIDCPVPGCPGEKISYSRGGSHQWFCSDGGTYCWVVWRAARVKALMDLREGKITEEQMLETIDAFIKEYEKHVERTKNS